MSIANVDAAKAWDGDDGAHWTEYEERYNTSMRRHTGHLFAAAGLTGDHDVLDVGCGCGDTTRRAAHTARTVLGVDLSSQMLARATERAAEEGLTNITFRQADAQVEPFPDAAYDVVLSRAGVMFFVDPVAAFANLHRATRPGGRLTVLTWQVSQSSWVSTLRESLAAGRDLPVPPPGAPGPMSLSDPNHVREVLGAAGWRSIDFIDVVEPMDWGPSVEEAVDFASTTGVARSLLADLDEPTRAKALETLRTRVSRFAGPDGVLVPARAWVVTARA